MNIQRLFVYACVCVVLLWSGCARQSAIENRDNIVVGTFNIAWLGDGTNDRVDRTDEDYKRIAEVIRETGVDIMGLQEVENAEAVDRVLQYLPGYERIVGTKGRQQNVAAIYRSDIEVRLVEEYAPIAITEGRNRPGLILQCKAGNFDWLMMVVHLKSTSRYDSTDEMREESYRTRRLQARRLHDWAETVVGETEEKDIIVVGDFNDTPTRKKNPTLNTLLADDVLTFLTTDLQSCKKASWKVIDHIVVSKSASNRYVDGTAMNWNMYQQYDKDDAEKVSDHCPIIAQFETVSPDND